MHYLRDLGNTFLVTQQVLANLDANVRQADFFCMVIDRVVLWRLARVRHIIADVIACIAKTLEEDMPETLVLVPENANLSRP